MVKRNVLNFEDTVNKNIEDVKNLLGWCKLDYPNLKIYIWTGYTIEELMARNNPTVNTILYILTHKLPQKT